MFSDDHDYERKKKAIAIIKATIESQIRDLWCNFWDLVHKINGLEKLTVN